MGTQPRLAGTLPSPEVARKNHKTAVAMERTAKAKVDELSAALREMRAELRKATRARETAEDDLDAIEEGRRPDK